MAMGVALVRGGCDAFYNDVNDGSGVGCDRTCPNLIDPKPTTFVPSSDGDGDGENSTESPSQTIPMQVTTQPVDLVVVLSEGNDDSNGAELDEDVSADKPLSTTKIIGSASLLIALAIAIFVVVKFALPGK